LFLRGRSGGGQAIDRGVELAADEPSIFAVLKSHFETLSHFLNQVIRSACSPQKPSGLEIERP